jgi:HAMP domain-containing protein
MTTFSIASRDELWLRGSLTESRLMHGVATQRGDSIDASDASDGQLVRACEVALDEARATVVALRDARVRVVVRAVREDDVESVETTITVAMNGVSVVTTPANAIADYELLHHARNGGAPLRGAIVWSNGSAAVLLHEAFGHASEHDVAAVAWPAWLSIDAPLSSRRETFRDVPLMRMSHLIARQNNAPFVVAEDRIDVQLVAGGGYDPMTDIVTIDIAVSSAGPFTIRRSRAEVAASLAGASGEPIRYPGVICSREGQELYVASHAPAIVTHGLL